MMSIYVMPCAFAFSYLYIPVWSCVEVAPEETNLNCPPAAGAANVKVVLSSVQLQSNN